MERETIEFLRDCPATQIPSGESVQITKGTGGVILQALGGAFTVMTDQGMMVRLEGKDGDAIGKESLTSAQEVGEELTLEERVWRELKTCYDPEIPVNIVDLGLIYGCIVTPMEGGGHYVHIDLTLTAPGCGMGPVLQADVEKKVRAIPGVRETEINLVFEPPWDQSRMTDAARLELNLF